MREEKTGRPNDGMIWSTSPQISESNPLPPASNTPTTLQSDPPNFSDCPMATPAKFFAMFFPTITSPVPNENILPSVIRTRSRSAREAASTPRTVTFPMSPLAALRRLIMTKISAVASGFPSGPSASSGWVLTMLTASRSIWLWSSA